MRELHISFSEPEKQEIQLPEPVREPETTPLTIGQRWVVIGLIGGTVLSGLFIVNSAFQAAARHGQELQDQRPASTQMYEEGYNDCQSQYNQILDQMANQVGN
jgi:hypothetical protein